MDLVNLMLSIIENPLAEKGYRDLKKYYEKTSMYHEAEAIGDLISFRFYEHSNTPVDIQQ